MAGKRQWKLGKRRSFFVQLLLSNIAIATVCALAVFFLSMVHSLRIEQKQMQEEFISSSKIFERDFKRTINSLYSIVSNLVFYQNIEPFFYNNGSSDEIESIRTLSGVQASNPFLSDLYVHFYDDDYAYSSKSSMKVEFLASELDIDLSKKGNLQETLTKYMSPVYRIDQNRLLVFYPILYNYENRGVIIFSITNKTFSQLLGNNESQQDITLLFSGDEELFLDERSKNILQKLHALPELNLQKKLLEKESFFWNGENYSVIGDSISPQLYFIRVSDTQGVLSMALENPWIYLVLALGSACTVLLFTLYITRKNYQPVRALRNTLTNIPESEALEEKNISDTFQEFQLFLNKYTELQGKNIELEKGLQEKFALEQNQLLHSLINGSTSQYEDFKSQALDLNIDVSAAYHLIASVSGDKSAFLDSVRPLLEYRYRYSYPISGAQDEILYIIGCDEAPAPEALAQINASDNMRISIPEKNIKALHNQYLSLKIAQSMSADSCQSIHDLASELLENYMGDISFISAALDSDNAEAFSALTSTFLLDLKAGRYSEATSKYLCFRLFYLYKNYETSHLSGGKSQIIIPETMILTQSQKAFSIKDLAERFEIQTNIIIKLMSTQRESKMFLSIDNILAYIQEKYVEPDFSLQSVASAFEVSPSYLSIFFKENHGMKMLDYCTLLRFEKARELLHTDLSLLEISQQTGYYNTSSFIRRFKQVCGITPGEYKKQNPPE